MPLEMRINKLLFYINNNFLGPFPMDLRSLLSLSFMAEIVTDVGKMCQLLLENGYVDWEPTPGLLHSLACLAKHIGTSMRAPKEVDSVPEP
jgi:hypothetical protein